MNIDKRLKSSLSGYCIDGLGSSKGNDISSICTPRAVRSGYNLHSHFTTKWNITRGYNIHFNNFLATGGIMQGQVSIGRRRHKTVSLDRGSRREVNKNNIKTFRIWGSHTRHINPYYPCWGHGASKNTNHIGITCG